MPLVFALAIAASLAGCTLDGPAAPPPDVPQPERHEEQFTLTGYDLKELNFEMAKGARLRIVVEASAPVAWDLHSHSGRNVTTWSEGQGTRVDEAFDVPEDNVYSVFLRALGATADVTLALEGNLTLLQ